MSRGDVPHHPSFAFLTAAEEGQFAIQFLFDMLLRFLFPILINQTIKSISIQPIACASSS